VLKVFVVLWDTSGVSTFEKMFERRAYYKVFTLFGLVPLEGKHQICLNRSLDLSSDAYVKALGKAL
jgi:hypothetical protein